MRRTRPAWLPPISLSDAITIERTVRAWPEEWRKLADARDRYKRDLLRRAYFRRLRLRGRASVGDLADAIVRRSKLLVKRRRRFAAVALERRRLFSGGRRER